MKDLPTQEMFEELWTQSPEPGPDCFDGCRDADNSWIVYFTAAWCGPCKRLNCDELDKVAKERELTIWKCDAVVNDYTAGYCAVKAFPTFMHFRPKKVVSMIQSNDTEAVKRWLREQ
jgi:thioredoxin-like negative regulator of GroEL